MTAGRARLAAAALLLVASSALATTRGASAATDPFPSNLTVEGDSWPQYTVQRLQNDAFVAGATGSLAPKFTAVTPGEAAARADLASGTTDIAAVSTALTTSDLTAAQQNGITPGYVAYGLSGVAVIVALTVAPGFPALTSLNLTIPTLAKIFTHQIQSWSSPEILAENPSEQQSLLHPKAPQVPIQVVERRTSSSTTTALIATFLADPAARPIWNTYATTLGAPADSPVDVWPSDPLTSASGVTAGEEGVITTVLDLQATGPPGPQNAIGYVAPQWAQANSAVTVSLAPGGSSSFVAPTASSIQAAFSSPGVTFDGTSDLYTIDYTKLSNAGAYPAPLPAYLAVPLRGGRATKSAATAGFLNYVLSSAGQSDDTATGTVPLPANALTAAQAVASAFKANNSQTTSTTAASTTTSTSTVRTTASTSSSSLSSAGSSGASSSSGLPATGRPLPVVLGAVVLAMLLVGGIGRRRVLARAARRRWR